METTTVNNDALKPNAVGNILPKCAWIKIQSVANLATAQIIVKN